MPSVEAGIANVALLHIGQLELLDSLDDDTPAGHACKALWDLYRDATLEAFAWPFATARAVLSLVSGGERSGWAYAYVRPNDCIAVRYLYPGTTTPGEGQQIPFAEEGGSVDARGLSGPRLILTNQPQAELVYTARIERPALWSPMFRDALAARLAAVLAMSLAKNPALGSALLQLFERKVAQAAAAGFNQAQKGEPADSAIVRDRG